VDCLRSKGKERAIAGSSPADGHKGNVRIDVGQAAQSLDAYVHLRDVEEFERPRIQLPLSLCALLAPGPLHATTGLTQARSNS
jgi:hypothetical protein